MTLKALDTFEPIRRLPSRIPTTSHFRARSKKLLALAVALVALSPGPLFAQAGGAHRATRPPLEILQRAHTLFAQGDYENAQKYYLEVLPSFPENFDILKDLAYCFYATGVRGYSQAALYYARAYAINPHSGEVAENLIHCYMALKRYDEAAAVALKMAQSPGAPAEAWARVAEAYEAAREMDKAASAYQAYLQRDPGDSLARTSPGFTVGGRITIRPSSNIESFFRRTPTSFRCWSVWRVSFPGRASSAKAWNSMTAFSGLNLTMARPSRARLLS